MSGINENVSDLAAKIKKSIKVDNKTGVSEVQDDVWESTLPEGLTKEQIKAVKNHETNFVAATTMAVGDLALAAMKKNHELDEVSASVGMYGYDKVQVNVMRQDEYPNLRNPDAGPIVKLGATRTKFSVHGGKNAGELKKVFAYITEEAQKALKK